MWAIALAFDTTITWNCVGYATDPTYVGQNITHLMVPRLEPEMSCGSTWINKFQMSWLGNGKFGMKTAASEFTTYPKREFSH